MTGHALGAAGAIEAALCWLTLARNPGCVLSRDSLIDRVGGRDRAPNDRTIDVLVGRIRRKIEANPKDPRIVITVQGVGYVLAA